MEAIVLAGSLGTRLRSTVPDLPKPMAPVAGRPFLECLLAYWTGQGVTRFILSVGYRRDAITGHFGTAWCGVPVSYAVEETPLGTGGALLLATESLSRPGPFLVLNGDTYFEVTLGDLLEFHRKNRADATFSLFRSPQQGRYTGLRLAASGEVLSLTAAEPGAPANGGVYLMERAWLERRLCPKDGPCSFETDMLPGALQAGKRLYGREFSGTFIDIGVPEDYARAGEILARREPQSTNHDPRS